MFLKEIRLRLFRSYQKLDLVLVPGVNIFAGPNGAGKSNILEAVAVLAAGESHRSAENKQFFSWDAEEFALEGVFSGEEDILLAARQARGRPRRVSLNNAAQKRARDWLGRVPLVSFSPEDLGLVKGDPSTRRAAVNDVLSQSSPDYADLLQRYAKVLEERNAALKSVQEGRAAPSCLEPWDLSLLREGAALSIARRDFVSVFAPVLAERHAALSSGSERAGMLYKPSFVFPAPASIEVGEAKGEAAEVIAANRRRLRDLRDGEVATGSSLIGPHRDDVEFFLNDRPAKAFASQGQQRTLAVAFKLAERLFLKTKAAREPICLLDDMLSELDPARRGNLHPLLSDGAQCLVTMTSPGDWSGLEEAAGAARFFEVGNGVALPAEAWR